MCFIFYVSLFASVIHFEICVIGIPVLLERCLGDRLARSGIVFTPASCSSSALLEPIPLISVSFDSVADS